MPRHTVDRTTGVIPERIKACAADARLAALRLAHESEKAGGAVAPARAFWCEVARLAADYARLGLRPDENRIQGMLAIARGAAPGEEAA